MSRLSIADLVVDRGDRRVLDGVSLSVETGEIVALVGPNGAGKTTLLDAVRGVLEPIGGTIRLGDRRVGSASQRAIARRVASVPQACSTGFELTVEDLVGMGRTPHRSRFELSMGEADRRAVERALDRLDLDGLADRSLTAISGGQRKRAYLARALAQDAPLLALDEPTASLDVAHARSILEVVADLAREGRAVIAAIHDLDLAARYADRIAVLAEGTIQARGPPRAVFDSGAIETAFETNVGVATDAVTGTPTVRPIGADPAGDRVHVFGGGPLAARTIARLADAGQRVSVGPVREGDLAAQAAGTRAMPVVRSGRAGPIDERAIERACSMAAEADGVVLAGVAAGHEPIADRLLEGVDRAVRVREAGAEPDNQGEAGSGLSRTSPETAREALATDAARLDGKTPDRQTETRQPPDSVQYR